MSSTRIGPIPSSTPAFSSDESASLELATVSPAFLARLVGGDEPMPLVALSSSALLGDDRDAGCNADRQEVDPSRTPNTGCEESDDNDDRGSLIGPGIMPCLLQLVPMLPPDQWDGHDDAAAMMKVHPLVLECCNAATTRGGTKDSDSPGGDEERSSSSVPVRLYPLSLPYASPMRFGGVVSARLATIPKGAELADGSIVEIEVVFLDPELEHFGPSVFSSNTDTMCRLDDLIAEALQGRWILKHTTHVLSLRGSCAVVMIHSLWSATDRTRSLEGAHLIGSVGTFRVQVLPVAIDLHDLDSTAYYAASEPCLPMRDPPTLYCPGYEHIVKQIRDLLMLQGPAALAGILLSGCRGVGKTRIATCVARQISRERSTPGLSRWIVHSISLNDLLRNSGWATEDDLLMQLLPSDVTIANGHDRLLLLVDDLDVLSLLDSDSSSDLDTERRLVRNSLVQAVDRLVTRGHKVMCASRNGAEGSRLPPELLKASRLEKVVTVEAPTQAQREQILAHMLRQLGLKEEAQSRSWSETIASRTQGCVASDLRRIGTDAWSRFDSRASDTDGTPAALQWEDLVDAARSCIPSQLAMLDVTKPLLPTTLERTSSPDSWLRIHEASWSSLAGYGTIIRRIYRTVVVPWRMYISARDSITGLDSIQVPPPSGVLFHGSSGNGKSAACTCLASSLGLPLIRVRAADVLDKYLGGSEAVVRSLFARARSASPAILLFDEIDSIATNRASDGDGTGVMSRILSTLLNEMDGVSSGLREPVLVLACTNRIDALDAALLRPGRLEEHIEFPPPALEDAEAILKLYLRKVTVDSNVDVREIATKLVLKGFSAAAVEGLAREAVMSAFRRSDPKSNVSSVSVLETDFEDAMLELCT